MQEKDRWYISHIFNYLLVFTSISDTLTWVWTRVVAWQWCLKRAERLCVGPWAALCGHVRSLRRRIAARASPLPGTDSWTSPLGHSATGRESIHHLPWEHGYTLSTTPAGWRRRSSQAWWRIVPRTLLPDHLGGRPKASTIRCPVGDETHVRQDEPVIGRMLLIELFSQGIIKTSDFPSFVVWPQECLASIVCVQHNIVQSTHAH